MKIENQVCTLEQAKRLKELGVLQESLYWTDGEVYKCIDGSAKDIGCYSAFTVVELGALIGRGTHMAEKHWHWLLDCVNAGCSGTVAYSAISLAGFVIAYLEGHPHERANASKRLTEA